MKLMIIESPGKVVKLTQILGGDWKVAASVGHVRDLPQKEMGVEAPDFLPQYVFTERGGDVVARLKSLARDADAVYLATDPDREGEAISWHLQQCLKLKNPQRVTFGEITAQAVKTALLNPRAIDGRRVAAQEARRVLDRLVGYMVSPKLSEAAGERLSAGRVQSPATRLVVERERAIKAFKETQHFSAVLFFADAKTEWSAEWMTKPDFVTDEAPYFMDRDFASAVADVGSVEVAAFEDGKAKRSPPPPFTTSTMQQAGSVALGLSPKRTMEVAQKLFEQGLITYHRTDNPNVSDESLGDIYAVAVQLGLDMADEPRRFKSKEGAQEGHPAITPTDWAQDEAGETEEQRSLYRLIRLRAIACQLADAQYAVRTVQLDAIGPVQGRAVKFEARGRTLTYPGWLKLLSGDDTEAGGEVKEPTNPIPALAVGQRLAATRGQLLDKKTKPPARFTEASLVKKLEELGIGRPATTDKIIDTIVTRGYVRLEKKHLMPTPTGDMVVDALVGSFDFIDLNYTRHIEEDLDRIAKGEAVYRSVISDVYEKLQRELSTMQVSAIPPKHPCPECAKSLRRIPGKSGYFWGCTGHPSCSVTLPDEAGKPGQRKPQAVSDFACAKCGRPLAHRVKKGKGGYDFFGCTGFAQGCKESYPNKSGKPDFAKAK